MNKFEKLQANELNTNSFVNELFLVNPKNGIIFLKLIDAIPGDKYDLRTKLFFASQLTSFNDICEIQKMILESSDKNLLMDQLEKSINIYTEQLKAGGIAFTQEEIDLIHESILKEFLKELNTAKIRESENVKGKNSKKILKVLQ